MERIKNIITAHQNIFIILGLSVLFYFIFFHNIWAYALMDVDETRYVSMAKDMFNTKDFLTLYLNNEYFFEKPPLYFWGECLSFALFGKITEATARFPVALYGTLCCYLTYFICSRIVSKSYGVISALVLATSLEFLILSKFAILDIVVATCVWFSLVSGLMTQFCSEKSKKYYWWLFYIFSGLAVLAKGIPGFVIPFGSMFFISIFSKKFKEIFKPQYIVVGFLLFFLITIPWHYIMLKMHDPLFFNEYIIKHHLARFCGGNELGRQQPFYFYFLTILWGFFPWILSCLYVLITKIMHKDFKFTNLTNTQKFLVYNSIIAVFTFTFFSLSSTKLITYILPLYPSLSCLGGYIWLKYIERGEYSQVINRTVYFIGTIFVIASIVALFTNLYLPEQLNNDIQQAKPLCITLLFLCGILSVIFAKKEKYILIFFTYVIFMLSLSAFGTQKFFNIDYAFGQNDLIKFAKYAKNTNSNIICYNFTHKYSLIYYGKSPVKYNVDNIIEVKNLLKDQNNLVIVKKKEVDDAFKTLNFKVIDEGRRYILIKGMEK